MLVLNILTTATPRKKLHEKSLYRQLKRLKEENLFDHIKWFVNLDKPSIFDDNAFNLTKKHLMSFEFLDIHYTECLEKPTFAKAGKRVFENCSTQLNGEDNNYFFWLEDDWYLDVAYLQHVKKFIESDKQYYPVSGTQRATGRPSFFRSSLFYATLNKMREKSIDPEFAMMYASNRVYDMIFDKNYPRGNIPDKYLYLSGERHAGDYGTNWRKVRGIEKTNRYNSKIDTWVKN
jgi:hypothetical protein